MARHKAIEGAHQLSLTNTCICIWQSEARTNSRMLSPTNRSSRAHKCIYTYKCVYGTIDAMKGAHQILLTHFCMYTYACSYRARQWRLKVLTNSRMPLRTNHFSPVRLTGDRSLQHTAKHCNTLQNTAMSCDTLKHNATHCNALRHTATHCSALQDTCDTLQHTATHWHCNTPITTYMLQRAHNLI